MESTSSHFELEEIHPTFRRVFPTLEQVAGGFTFTEGPVWLKDHLLFSDIPNSRTVCYRPSPEGPHISTFRHPTGNANGLTLDRQNNLIACEHTTRQVTRVDAHGQVTVLASAFNGKRLNSPNDVIVRSDGTVYFTDPPYGLRNFTEGKELDFNGVFKLDPDGQLHVIADDFERPNGLALSPDEKTLYVDDSARFHIRRFEIAADGAATGGQVWAELPARPGERGVPDGMKVNTEGSVFCTGPGGVWVFNDGGRVMGRVHMPEVTANLAWGGDHYQTLYMTASTSLYRLHVNVPGLPAGNPTK